MKVFSISQDLAIPQTRIWWARPGKWGQCTRAEAETAADEAVEDVEDVEAVEDVVDVEAVEDEEEEVWLQ